MAWPQSMTASSGGIHHKTWYAGGPYAVFAGKECARALALMSTKLSDANGYLGDLPEEKMKILRDWEAKFMAKYRVVGAAADRGVDIENVLRKNLEALGEIEAPEPTGHKGPLLVGITAVAGAAVVFGASLLPIWGK